MSKVQSRYQGKPKGPRWPLIAAIAAFHVVVLYGLSRLLAPDFTAAVEREVASVFTVDVALEDPPPVEQPLEPDEGAQGAAGEEAVPQPVTAPSAPIERLPEPRPSVS